MQLFPFIVERSAGGSFLELAKMEAIKSYRLALYIFSIENQIEHHKKKLEEILYIEISRKDIRQEQRNRLLELKRNIHNNKEFSFVIKLEELKIYSSLIQQKKELKEKFKKALNQELKSTTFLLSNSMDDDCFLHALSFGSLDLKRNIIQYLIKANKTNPKKLRQTQNGAIKYFSRYCTKTSPLSYFSSSAIISLKKTSKKLQNLSESCIVHEINPTVFAIFNKLFSSNTILKDHHIVQVNPATEIHDEQIYSIILNQNKEYIFATTLNDSIRFIFDSVRQSKITYQELREVLINSFESDLNSIDGFLQKLFQTGLLIMSPVCNNYNTPQN